MIFQVFFKSFLLQKKISGEHVHQLGNIIDELGDASSWLEEYAAVIVLLIGDCNESFTDFEKHDTIHKLAIQPHLVDITMTRRKKQQLYTELMYLPVDAALKSLFDTKKDPIEIWTRAVESPRFR